MLRYHNTGPSQQPDLPQSQHHRGSSYHALQADHGHQANHPAYQHERNSSIKIDSVACTPEARRENAFTSPRPALLPYQEYHSGFTTDDDLAGSPLSSPTNSHSHRRQTSFSALFPLAIRNRTPSPTRQTPVLPEEPEMPYTGDGRISSRPGTAVGSSPQRGGFAGWLSSTAAGHALDSSRSPDVTPTRLRKSQTAAFDNNGTPTTTTESVSTRASRFMSALSARITPQTSAPSLSSPVDDELYNLSIDTALFPPTSPADRDAFSPAAFKNLQTNAVGLLSKFQSAYRAKVNTLAELEADRAAQRDEMEEAVTRAAHLRSQLEGMALRAAEQEKAMQAVVEQLEAERRGREEERRQRMSLRQRMVMPPGDLVSETDPDAEEDAEEEWARARKRKSAESGGSRSTFDETDEESVDESVFSRSRSPTGTATTLGGVSGDLPAAAVRSGGTVRARNNNGAQMSTFQKIIKNIAGDVEEADGCRNCQGKDASVAWDTVSLLRDENKHLKQRVGQLEVAVEGALDLVNGLGL